MITCRAPGGCVYKACAKEARCLIPSAPFATGGASYGDPNVQRSLPVYKPRAMTANDGAIDDWDVDAFTPSPRAMLRAWEAAEMKRAKALLAACGFQIDVSVSTDDTAIVTMWYHDELVADEVEWG